MTDVNIPQFTLNNELEKNNQHTLPGDDLTKLSSVGKSLEMKLKEKGFTTFTQIAECTPQRLSRKIEGIGIKKAQTIITSAKKLLEANDSEPISEKKYDGKVMFDPKYKIDRTSKIIPSQRELNKEMQPENIPKEEDDGEEETEVDTKEATEYDSFVVEPFVENEFPSEEGSDDLEDNEIEDIITDELEFVEQKRTPKRMEEHVTFNPEIEERIKSLVNTFIENKDEEKYVPSKGFDNHDDDNDNKSLLEKESVISGESHSYEEDIELENEIMSAAYLNELIGQSKNKFQSKGYTILSHKIEGIDFLALKIFHIEDELKIISIIPVKICNLEGSLIIGTSKIEYYPIHREYEGNDFITEELCGHIEESLKKAQTQILWNISTERTVFHYLKKKYDRKLEIEKTKRSKKLFLRAGYVHYKIIVDPLVLCKQDAEFNEKILPFPYLRESNIHFIQNNKLPELLAFLEQKYTLIENRYNNENIVKAYFQTQDKFIASTKYYSIPFVSVLFGLLIIMCSVPLFSHIFFNLSLGAITVYCIILGYLYLNFYKKKEGIINDFETPYYKRIVKLDETDLDIIHEKLSLEVMDQFIYECFGKNANFNVIANIEAKKADVIHYHREFDLKDFFIEEDSADEFLFAKGRPGDGKKKNRTLGTNYHLFMED